MRAIPVGAMGMLILAGCVSVNLPEIPPYHPGYAQAETGAVAPAPPILDLSTAPPTASPGLPVPGPSDLEPGTIRSDQMGKTPMTGNIHQEHGMMQHGEHGQMGGPSHGAMQEQGQMQGGMQHGGHQGQEPMRGEMPQDGTEKKEEGPTHEGMEHEGHSMAPQPGPDQEAVQGQTHPGHKMYEPKAEGSGTDGKAVYTCPMHPEVVSDRPGSCPKCGMVLHKKEAPK